MPLCQLWDAECVLPEGVCVLVDIKREELGIRQQENEAASHLGYCVEPLEVRIIKPLHDLKGFIHTVVDWVTAVTLCLLQTHTGWHAYFRNCKGKLHWNFDLKMRLGVKSAFIQKIITKWLQLRKMFIKLIRHILQTKHSFTMTTTLEMLFFPHSVFIEIHIYTKKYQKMYIIVLILYWCTYIIIT